jgi:hypothetical protein
MVPIGLCCEAAVACGAGRAVGCDPMAEARNLADKAAFLVRCLDRMSFRNPLTIDQHKALSIFKNAAGSRPLGGANGLHWAAIRLTFRNRNRSSPGIPDRERGGLVPV